MMLQGLDGSRSHDLRNVQGSAILYEIGYRSFAITLTEVAQMEPLHSNRAFISMQCLSPMPNLMEKKYSVDAIRWDFHVIKEVKYNESFADSEDQASVDAIWRNPTLVPLPPIEETTVQTTSDIPPKKGPHHLHRLLSRTSHHRKLKRTGSCSFSLDCVTSSSEGKE
ncbi:hypothetical protein KIN20_007801 [Parelaphostrongylus tenuis]|uniref:Uncharacterized protein n=1 Tax=Parelaphostrongylus tenuis TaxID=148309 RepID=A0AAD5QI39_PARTN|nr:hypothetical protein KIN20_007801 [Parelaphostrongylus tenuis]